MDEKQVIAEMEAKVNEYQNRNYGQAMQAAPELNARELLHQRLKRLRQEARRLEALLDALPARLGPEADTALCDLILNARL